MGSSTQEEEKSLVVAKLSATTKVKVEPAGRWYEAYCLRRRNKQSLSHHSLQSSSSESSVADVSTDEEDEAMLKSLDPKEWKNQDHYAVLGLGKLRYKATEDQLKRAYKRKVLKHHPDKRKARGQEVKDDEADYFTCITRAYEILGNPIKRRSYNSVDPTFDDEIPSVDSAAKQNFFETFKTVFEANSRWSNKTPVPDLGDENSTYEEVNHFYSFWYDFDSWREYSYLDEEEKEKGENREERKWIERQNKAARQKRKKEEVSRIRELVDNAYACDPRIQRFKEEEKEKKLAQKRAKQEAARARAEEEDKKRKQEEEVIRLQKEKEEEEARQAAAAAKKEKDAQKKAFKKERKTLRTALKDYDYFAEDETQKVKNMQDVDKLAESLSLLSLQTLNENLTSGDKEKAQTAFIEQVKLMNEELEKEKQRLLEASQKQSGGPGGESGGKSKSWSEEELQVLIKAVTLFPAGTNSRWEVIANFIGQHVAESNKNAKDVLTKVKSLQKIDGSQKQAVNEKAFEKFEKKTKAAAKKDKADISERFESVAEQQVAETGTNPTPWTADEQKLLEQALKTYGASTPERWEKIASVIPTRSKKDCMKRYKELVEMVKAKKAAQAAAASKAKKT